MKVQADYIPVTGSSVLTKITIQFDRKDLQFKQKEGVSTATVNIYGRITTMSRRPVNCFEEDLVQVDVPTEMLQQAMDGVRHLSEDASAAAGPLPVEHRRQGSWSAATRPLMKWRWTFRASKTTSWARVR